MRDNSVNAQLKAANAANPGLGAMHALVHPSGHDVLAPRSAPVSPPTVITPPAAASPPAAAPTPPAKPARKRSRDSPVTPKFSWVVLQPPPGKGGEEALQAAPHTPGTKPPSKKKLRGHAGFHWVNI